MNREERLKKSFLEEIQGKTMVSKARAKDLLDEERQDEANFEKIKTNVYDIFEKMFNISYKNIYSAKNQANTDREKYQLLEVEFLKFLEKIPAPWKQKAIKDKEHGLIEDLIIEELKISTAEEIRDLFQHKYEKFQ
ncbi:hypothetical protein HYG86_10040 [Alkalicella caledoniensis]|uniref:Uncharacterized protein n=1 Tax=Alkalicella caledoniensis TaxID=2731377 RepID=A0A7G9W8R7_ALKCA|nr:hypothetical protein [Alkalicella caledoniensis]QNO15079.1 hypothetical protein HYG86_10040 [Alkalicella caledoniensis]